MPRGRRMRDGRNPYGSRGGYVTSRRSRRDRAMEEDYARNYSNSNRHYDHRRDSNSYEEQDYERNSRDYEQSRQRNMDYGDYADMRGHDYTDYEYDMSRGRGRDGHYPSVQGYMPVEAMGRFTGYYGMGEDYARGRGKHYYMARGGRGRDYGYDYGDMEYLEEEDIKEWEEKLKDELEEKDKQFFSKENIKHKAEQMGIKFDKYSIEEFMVTALMVYTDYCKTLGTANMDIYLRLAKDWLEDKDAGVKYGEKLASYYDSVVDPE